MQYKKPTYKIMIFFFLVVFCFSCKKEECLNCNTYNMLQFKGDLGDSTGTFFICENDDMWDDIVWGEYNHNDAGDFSFIDLDEYTLGYRIINNNDIDNDGILNDIDNDIDNDGVLNYEDSSPYGTKDNSIIELIICTNN